MKRAIHMQEVRKMRFKESYDGWQSGRKPCMRYVVSPKMLCPHKATLIFNHGG